MPIDLDRTVTRLVSQTLEVNPARVLPDTSFEELGADSLDRLELVLATEDQFQLHVPDEEAERIRTTRDLVRFLAAQDAHPGQGELARRE